MKRQVIVVLLVSVAFSANTGNKAKVVIIAGTKDHRWGAYEHRAGAMLLADRLNNNMPNIETVVVTGG